MLRYSQKEPNGSTIEIVYSELLKRINFLDFELKFSRNGFSIVLSLFIHKISSKHDRDYNIQAEFKLTFITRITFCQDVRFRFWTLFGTQLINFIQKYFLLFILDFNIRILKAYLQYNFTVQRVNEASFLEVTTSRSCEDVSGFHNVIFGPGGKAMISCSVFR